ncbi:MAG: VOC family protein [Bacteroidia bacterium]|nr:VOC family protein [Bacteroidia bacterium]
MSGLRTVIYNVPDLQKGKEWYTQAFNTKPYFDQPFYVGFNIGGYELGLVPDPPAGGHYGGSVTAYWAVENVEAEFKRLITLGGSEIEPPSNVGGEIVVATVADLWGNPIGLIFNPDFKLD